jgi:hypothetical protein
LLLIVRDLDLPQSFVQDGMGALQVSQTQLLEALQKRKRLNKMIAVSVKAARQHKVSAFFG